MGVASSGENSATGLKETEDAQRVAEEQEVLEAVRRYEKEEEEQKAKARLYRAWEEWALRDSMLEQTAPSGTRCHVSGVLVGNDGCSFRQPRLPHGEPAPWKWPSRP